VREREGGRERERPVHSGASSPRDATRVASVRVRVSERREAREREARERNQVTSPFLYTSTTPVYNGVCDRQGSVMKQPHLCALRRPARRMQLEGRVRDRPRRRPLPSPVDLHMETRVYRGTSLIRNARLQGYLAHKKRPLQGYLPHKKFPLQGYHAHKTPLR
jgi:hypothetical protein